MRNILMLIILLILSALLAVAPDASAQIRLTANADVSQVWVGTDDFQPELRWYNFKLEVEHEFEKEKLWFLSGFAGGVNKEGKSLYNGTYVTGRLFRTFETEPVSVIFSGGVIYGLIGWQFDRTQLEFQGNDVIGYDNVSMKRNMPIPYMEAEKAGVLQPVFDVRLRKYLDWFFVETKAGVRFARFSTVSSDYKNSRYNESLVALPSLGIGLGVSF